MLNIIFLSVSPPPSSVMLCLHLQDSKGQISDLETCLSIRIPRIVLFAAVKMTAQGFNDVLSNASKNFGSGPLRRPEKNDYKMLKGKEYIISTHQNRIQLALLECMKLEKTLLA